MLYFEKIINRLKKALKIDTDKELYELMNVKQATFTNWRTRNKIPFEEINTLCVNKNIDLNYIINDIEPKKKEIDFKKSLLEIIDNMNDKQLEYMYHLAKAEEIKENELNVDIEKYNNMTKNKKYISFEDAEKIAEKILNEEKEKLA